MANKGSEKTETAQSLLEAAQSFLDEIEAQEKVTVKYVGSPEPEPTYNDRIQGTLFPMANFEEYHDAFYLIGSALQRCYQALKVIHEPSKGRSAISDVTPWILAAINRIVLDQDEERAQAVQSISNAWVCLRKASDYLEPDDYRHTVADARVEVAKAIQKLDKATEQL